MRCSFFKEDGEAGGSGITVAVFQEIAAVKPSPEQAGFLFQNNLCFASLYNGISNKHIGLRFYLEICKSAQYL